MSSSRHSSSASTPSSSSTLAGSSAEEPAALVMLYLSLDKFMKHVADESIRIFMDLLMSIDLHMKRYNECARFILVFCKLLRSVVGLEDPLYRFCRGSIRDILEAVWIARCKKNVAKELLALNDAFMFVREDVVDVYLAS
ncbi:hypothetical protein MTR67_051881 [Solanum verrucosum]|uniref:Uncharacterized protein n=1 Tax=Solanum verrucosum TaxID=315347 RepID=A0AAF0V8C7_SOLVR|nr:hypothetical protein MTR67_051881 [Solanum verrucosum]